MHILRVFNNNVVLARRGAAEPVILTGRGLGFQARPGQRVDEAKVARMFVPVDGRDPDHLGELLAGVSPEFIQIVTAAMQEAGLAEGLTQVPHLVVALADHLAFAVERQRTGTVVEYPLLAEVRNLYAAEYGQGTAMLSAINRRLTDPLPDSEVVALTLHLVNAGFTTGDLSYTYTMTGIIQQLITVIGATYGRDIDPHSVSAARFITHVRYLFVRIQQHEQLDQDHSAIGEAIRQTYPQAHQCAQRLGQVIAIRLGAELTEDELSYLTLHVARIAGEHGSASLIL